MNPKYLILYLAAATLALVMVIYQVITTNPAFDWGRIALNSIISIFFYYLAYKTYHEKKDRELM
ncbi:MAG TPA: hypothetical protein VGI43_01330 [Mucilaginibacter sp.]|jgi:ABC-type Fe3+-siderophore transport system permease subunit